jgi:rubrerythrin
MSFKEEVARSEFNLLAEKEREMLSLYSSILERVKNEHVRKVVESIRKDEKRHMGYAKIILSMLENHGSQKR